MGMLPIDKFARLFRIIRQHGGYFKSCYKLWIMDTLKEGVKVGEDCHGNKYYENYNYMIGRCRWVEYNHSVAFEYDPSMVNSSWYGWLHYKTDMKPDEDPAKQALYCNPHAMKWLLPPSDNATATDQAFYPYSTVKNTISVWDESSLYKKFGQTFCK